MALDKRKSVRFSALAISLIILISSFLSVSFVASGADDDVFDKFIVETVNPSNLNMNLFDYWVTGNYGENDNKTSNNTTYSANSTFWESGINNGHEFKFTYGFGKGTGYINEGTGDTVREGIVNSTLGSNGFPVLNQGHVFAGATENSSIGSTSVQTNESLSYLFDSTEFEGKKSYMGVSGLLQLDENGYYYYDSLKNFASYDNDYNLFKVYNKQAVRTGVNGFLGQFFLFSSASEVFTYTEATDTITSKAGVHANPWNGASRR